MLKDVVDSHDDKIVDGKYCGSGLDRNLCEDRTYWKELNANLPSTVKSVKHKLVYAGGPLFSRAKQHLIEIKLINPLTRPAIEKLAQNLGYTAEYSEYGNPNVVHLYKTECLKGGGSQKIPLGMIAIDLDTFQLEENDGKENITKTKILDGYINSLF